MSSLNPFEAPPIIDLEPVAPSTEQVGWEYFAPKTGTLGEMLEAIAETKRQLEAEAEQATAYYVQRRQIREVAQSLAQMHDSEILELCPQASADLGKYRAEAEAAVHWGVQAMFNGHMVSGQSSFKL